MSGSSVPPPPGAAWGGPRGTYWPAMDGLRALAVLAVLVYHGPVGWAPGGFLGVDVFFALSGFLITSLLLAHWRRWGVLDVPAFWLRRARRLLPAVVVMLAVVVPVAAWLTTTDQLRDLRLDALATLFYVANWRQVAAGESYFASFAAPSPLRHAWSLAIEEQFYLIFPLVLAAVLTWFRIQRGDDRPEPTEAQWRLLWRGLALGAVGSAVLMALAYQPGRDPSRVYYGTDTRAQALLVGAAVATLLTVRRTPPAWVARLAPVALAALAVLAVAADDRSAWLYRGGFLAVAGLSVLVVVGCTVPGPVRTVLSVEPLRLLGIISYGVYLWHWPVDVLLSEQRTGWSGVPLLAVQMALTVGLATASYLLVERPIRARRVQAWLGRTRTQVASGVALACTVALLLVVTVGYQPVLSPSLAGAATGGLLTPADVGSATPRPAPSPSGSPAQTGAAATHPPPTDPPTTDPPTTDPLTTMFVGDSVAFTLAVAIDPATQQHVRLYTSARIGCGLTPGARVIAGQVEPLPDWCPAWDRQWPLDVASVHPQVSVLWLGFIEHFDLVPDGGQRLRWGTPAYATYLRTQLQRYTSAMGADGAKVAVVIPPCNTMTYGEPAERALANDAGRTRWIGAQVRAFAATHPQVHLIDLYRWKCGDRFGAPGDANHHDGMKLTDDGLHFTKPAAALVWAWLTPQLRAIAAARS